MPLQIGCPKIKNFKNPNPETLNERLIRDEVYHDCPSINTVESRFRTLVKTHKKTKNIVKAQVAGWKMINNII